MVNNRRIYQAHVFPIAMALVAAAWQPVEAQKAGRDNFKRVPITTADGVELQATLWPSNGKDATVLLLHNFDRNKGGSSHQDGWDDLANALQQEGYTVLSFDFRGFGQSKTVSRDAFWSHSSNQMGINRRAKRGDTIDQKDFTIGYYINLVNDIAAAKAYLDRQNDLKTLNSSNIIVIGAGEGATLGALWMSLEFKLYRSPNGLIAPANNIELEGKDLTCAVWLDIKSTLAGSPVNVHKWLVDVAGRRHKVPMLFMYGKDDKYNEGITLTHLRSIVGKDFQLTKTPMDPAFELTRDWPVTGTKLTGSQLLNPALETAKILTFYLNDNMKKRGAREIRNRDYVKSAYFWKIDDYHQPLAKAPNEEVPRLIPLKELLTAR